MGYLINPFRFGGFSNLYSMFFDSISEYAYQSSPSNLDKERTDSFSISLWFNKSANPAIAGFILSKQDGGGNYRGYAIGLTSSGAINWNLISVYPTSTAYITTTSTYSNSTWYHLVVTYSGDSDADTMKIYINGVSQSFNKDFDNLSSTISNTTALQLGRRADGYYFNGYLDEITFWNKALSGSEVTELYNSGKPNNPTTHSSSANLETWNRMGDGATWDGSNWTIPDEISSNDFITFNMENADRTTIVP